MSPQDGVKPAAPGAPPGMPEEALGFKKLVRNISKSMLAVQGKRPDFEIAEIEGALQVFSHWMSLILISGPALKVTFKAHFKTSVAKLLAAPVFDKTPDDLTEEQGLDFVREFCNLTAGSLKKALLHYSIKTGVSLPVVTRGFDELFFSSGSFHNVYGDRWSVRCPAGEIRCSLSVEVVQPIDFTKITDTMPAEEQDSGDVEFL